MSSGFSRAHPGRLAMPSVQHLSPYVPGKPIGELMRELGLEDIVKLASNENPYGASPASLAAMQAALGDVWLYPDGSCHELKQALAQRLAVPPEMLTLGNGSNELLMLLAEAFLSPGRSAVYAQYGFAIYPLVIRATGAEAIEVPALPLDSDMPLGHDVAGMQAAIRPDTRLVFLANPNNPTGTWFGTEPLERLLEAAPASTLIVLDAAYFEYARERGLPDELPRVAACPNLVVLRTFSKAYGLAGARIGYAISHPEVADVLNRLRPAFNVNSLGQVGAIAALQDERHMRRAVEATMSELTRVSAGLAQLGLWCAPSAANFLLVRVGAQAPRWYRTLLERGIIVRPMSAYALADCLRITIGLPEHNDRLLATLGELVASDRLAASSEGAAAAALTAS